MIAQRLEQRRRLVYREPADLAVDVEFNVSNQRDLQNGDRISIACGICAPSTASRSPPPPSSGGGGEGRATVFSSPHTMRDGGGGAERDVTEGGRKAASEIGVHLPLALQP